MNKVNKVVCPDCKAKYSLSQKIEVGDIFECPKCATEVEVVSTVPFKYVELIEEK